MADLTITKLAEDRFYIAAGGSTFTHDWRWIESRLEEKAFDVNLRNASDDYTMISIQGPYSRQLLQSLTEQPISDDAWLPFSSCRSAKIAGHEAMVLRLTFVGELGYELHVPSGGAVEIYQAIMAAATPLREAGVAVENAGYRAIDSLSAEKGYRHWHADLTCRDTPAEAGIGFVAAAKLSKTETPFMGREALERQRAEGLRRRLVCLTIDELRPETPLHGRETLWRDGVCVGYVRSTAFGFSIGRQIAYGYVDAPNGEALKPKAFTEWLSAGSWAVGDRGAMRPSTLHLKAPFDPNNLRIKGEYPSASCPGERSHPLDPLFSE